MTNHRLRAGAVLAASLVLAATICAPAASARPAPAVVATWHVMPGQYDLKAGLGAMWAVRDDEFNGTAVYRIDASTNTETLMTTLPFPTGGFAIGYGSLWLADYFGDQVERLAPDGTLVATIAVGLQPQWMDVAFGSLWVANHHGASISRIDPTTNAVVATLPIGARHTFRSGPQAITHDATHLYAGSSDLPKLQTIDPATNSVSTSRTTTGDQFCQTNDALAGLVWSLDTNCSGQIYLFDPSGTQLLAFDSAAGFAESLTDLNGEIWLGVARAFDPTTSVYSQAVLEERDPTTANVVETLRIGGDATQIGNGFGDLWVFDVNKSTVRRVHV